MSLSVTGHAMMKGARAKWRAPGVVLFTLVLLCGLAMIGQGAIIPAKAALAQILLDRAFTRSLASHTPVKAWPWADSAPVARITVPRLNVSQVVLSGGSGEAMAFAPTLMPGASRPGEPGTTVFAAHRDTHFRFLKALRQGDLVVVQNVSGERSVYRVQGGQVVRHDQFGIDRYAAVPIIALTTCWPFDADRRGPWRYVITARRVT